MDFAREKFEKKLRLHELYTQTADTCQLYPLLYTEEI